MKVQQFTAVQAALAPQLDGLTVTDFSKTSSQGKFNPSNPEPGWIQ